MCDMIFINAELVKRSNTTDCKSVGIAFESSNLSLCTRYHLEQCIDLLQGGLYYSVLSAIKLQDALSKTADKTPCIPCI